MIVDTYYVFIIGWAEQRITHHYIRRNRRHLQSSRLGRRQYRSTRYRCEPAVVENRRSRAAQQYFNHWNDEQARHDR